MSESHNTNKNLWNNPWIVGIGTLVIGTFILDLLTDWVKNLLDFVQKIIVSLFELINESISMPIWVILIILFVLFLLIKTKLSSIIKNEAKSIINYPFLKYTSDKFGDSLYRWSYEKNNEDKYVITNITAFCPHDNCRLTYWGVCPICSQNYNRKNDSEINILIIHKIDNNLYK